MENFRIRSGGCNLLIWYWSVWGFNWHMKNFKLFLLHACFKLQPRVITQTEWPDWLPFINVRVWWVYSAQRSHMEENLIWNISGYKKSRVFIITSKFKFIRRACWRTQNLFYRCYWCALLNYRSYFLLFLSIHFMNFIIYLSIFLKIIQRYFCFICKHFACLSSVLKTKESQSENFKFV